MGAEQLRPEIRKTITGLPKLPFHIRPLIPLARFMYNFAAKSNLEEGVKAKTISANGSEVEVYAPTGAKSDAAVLWIYGGGHLAGKPQHLNRIASRVVKETSATVYAPKYRLAPKYPFPADLDDCYNCWTWMIENAKTLGINTERLAVGGNSAGGGLAAALSQRILDAGGPLPKAQILFYPMLDDRVAANKDLDALETFLWNNKTNRVAWECYLAPHEPGASDLPQYASPARRPGLSGLPAAWIGYGSLDLFAGEDAEYARRLKEAGVQCYAEVVNGVPHAFEAIAPDLDVSKAFTASAISFLKHALS